MKKTALLSFFVLVLAACGVVAPSSSESSSASSTTTSTTTSSTPSSSTTTSTTESTSTASSTTSSTSSSSSTTSSTSSSTTSSSSTASSSSSSSEFVPEITTIQNARLLNNGDDVTVRGVVTRIIRQQSFFIQEGDFGINIFRYLDTENPVSVGDYVEVYGIIENYEGLLEITGPEGVGVSLTFLNETAPTITPFTITEETWVNANLATNYDGRLITIEGLKLKNAWVPLALNNESSAGVNVDFLLGSKTILARFDRYISVSERTALNTLFSTLSNADTLTYTGILGDYRGIQLAVAVSSDFTVNDQPDILPTSVEIVAPVDFEGELVEGLTVQLSAIVLPENADNKAIIWSSSAEDVATVDNNGVVTALQNGSTGAGGSGITIITAKTVADNSIQDTIEITVVTPPPVIESILLVASEDNVGVGRTLQLTVTYLPVGFSGLGVSFSSSNETIATVSPSGLVTGLSVGAVEITATSLDDETLISKVDLNILELTNVNGAINLAETPAVGDSLSVTDAYVLFNLAYEQSLASVTVNGTIIIVATPEGVVGVNYFGVSSELITILNGVKTGSFISISGTVGTGTGGPLARSKYLSVGTTLEIANYSIKQRQPWVFGTIQSANTIDMVNGFKTWIDSTRNNLSDLGKFYVLTNVKLTTVGTAVLTSNSAYDHLNYSSSTPVVDSNNVGSSTTISVRIGLVQIPKLDNTVYNTTDTYTMIVYIGGSNQNFNPAFTASTILRGNYAFSIVKTN